MIRDLGLAALAEEDHVVAGDERVLELGQDGVLVAEDALDDGLAVGDAAEHVASDLLLAPAPTATPRPAARRAWSRAVRVGMGRGYRAPPASHRFAPRHRLRARYVRRSNRLPSMAAGAAPGPGGVPVSAECLTGGDARERRGGATGAARPTPVRIGGVRGGPPLSTVLRRDRWWVQPALIGARAARLHRLLDLGRLPQRRLLRRHLGRARLPLAALLAVPHRTAAPPPATSGAGLGAGGASPRPG